MSDPPSPPGPPSPTGPPSPPPEQGQGTEPSAAPPAGAWSVPPARGSDGRFRTALRRSSKPLLLGAGGVGVIVGIALGVAAVSSDDDTDELRAELSAAREDAADARDNAEEAAARAEAATTTTEATTTTTTTTLPPPPPVPPPPPPNAPTISLDEFNQLAEGMSYDQVVAIIGGPGTLSSEYSFGGITSQAYTWDGTGGLGANSFIQFQNGALIGKSQFGLA